MQFKVIKKIISLLADDDVNIETGMATSYAVPVVYDKYEW